jgi:hypothetical protein
MDSDARPPPALLPIPPRPGAAPVNPAKLPTNRLSFNKFKRADGKANAEINRERADAYKQAVNLHEQQTRAYHEFDHDSAEQENIKRKADLEKHARLCQ